MWNIKRYNKLCLKKFEDLHILRGKLDPVQPGDDMIRFYECHCFSLRRMLVYLQSIFSRQAWPFIGAARSYTYLNHILTYPENSCFYNYSTKAGI